MAVNRLYISEKMVKRLLMVFDDLHQTIGDVARASGIAYDTLNQIKIGRVKSMRCDTLAAIIQAYPSINANYILTGEGSAFLTPNLTDEVPTVYLRKVGEVNVKFEEE